MSALGPFSMAQIYEAFGTFTPNSEVIMSNKTFAYILGTIILNYTDHMVEYRDREWWICGKRIEFEDDMPFSELQAVVTVKVK